MRHDWMIHRIQDETRRERDDSLNSRWDETRTSWKRLESNLSKIWTRDRDIDNQRSHTTRDVSLRRKNWSDDIRQKLVDNYSKHERILK